MAKSYLIEQDSTMRDSGVIMMGGNNFWAKEKTFNTSRRDIKVTTVPMTLPKIDKKD